MGGFGDLYKTVAAYTLRPTTDYTVSGIDLLLQVINQAFTFAQQYTDWTAAFKVAQVSVDFVNGGDLGTAVLMDDGTTPVKINVIDCVYYQSMVQGQDGTKVIVPVELTFKKSKAIFVRERLRQRVWGNFNYRYRPDFIGPSSMRPISAYVAGNIIQFDPRFGPPLFPSTSPVLAVLDVYERFPVFTADDVTNNTNHFLIDNGWEYLLFKSLCLLNPLTLQFCMRTEGFLPPPESDWQRGLSVALQWDDDQYQNAMVGNHQI